MAIHLDIVQYMYIHLINFLLDFGYMLFHEILHSKKFGNNKDAYSTGFLIKEVSDYRFPFINLRNLGLYGINRQSYPIGSTTGN